MEFQLLGPVEARSAGRRLALGGAKPTALLAALLMHRGQVVPIERLIDLVWDDQAPPTARGLVASHVAALRREFAGVAQRPIVTRSPGYLIDTESTSVDAAEFEQAVTRLRLMTGEGRHREVADGLTAALALWRGERALEGLAMRFAVAEATRLAELRLAAIETRFDALLALGEEDGIVAELFGEVAAHPMRERLRGQLMVALYRIGRQADALRIYQEGQELIADELGLDPGPELRALRLAVLTEDAALLAVTSPTAGLAGSPAGPVADVVAAPTVPRQLPTDIVDFTGRDAAAKWVRELIDGAGTGQTAVPVGVISGRAGAGKTALAVRMAHELASKFPDGQLFLNLLTETRRVEPTEALERFLRALGVEPAMLPTGLDERVALYRTLLAQRRILVVLDNAADERQVRPVLPGSPTCAVLVTSRARLSGLEGAADLDLDMLDEDEAVALLARIVGESRVAGELDAAAQVVRFCGRLPLAVRIAGARLAARPHWTIARLASRLHGEHGRLDELTVGDLEVRASLALSYVGLPDLARTALRRLGVVDLPDFAAWAVAPLVELDVSEADDIVDQLVAARLVDAFGVDATGQPRYRMHDLVRLFARERAHAEDREKERNGGLSRMVSCWLDLLDRVAARHWSAVSRRPTGGTVRWSLDSDTAAALTADPVAWFAAELPSLVAIVEQCASRDLDEAACELASALIASPSALYNEFDAWSRTHETALAAVRRAGNRNGEGILLAGLGQLRFEQDRFAESHEYCREALALFRETGDLRGEAMALTGIGIVSWEQGNFAEARYVLERALAVFSTLDDHVAIANVRYNMGVVHREQGRYDDAMSELTAALSMYRATGSARAEALATRAIGLVHRARGEYSTAIHLFNRAVDVFEDLGDVFGTTYARQALAKALLRVGRTEQARTVLDAVLAICHDRRDRFGEALVTRTLGELYLVTEDLHRAEDMLLAALRQWDVLHVPLWRARTLRDLGRVYAARGDPVSADRVWAEAAETFQRVGSHEADEPLASYPHFSRSSSRSGTTQT